MDICIRWAETGDYDSVESIMKQVQQLHIDWRPDIYKTADPVYSRELFADLVKQKHILIAQDRPDRRRCSGDRHICISAHCIG